MKDSSDKCTSLLTYFSVYWHVIDKVKHKETLNMVPQVHSAGETILEMAKFLKTICTIERSSYVNHLTLYQRLKNPSNTFFFFFMHKQIRYSKQDWRQPTGEHPIHTKCKAHKGSPYTQENPNEKR